MTQPTVHLSIQDQHGRPVEGAVFHFAKYSISMLPRQEVNTIETDARGDVELESERKWQFFFLAPDSGQFWSWSWCIDKPGFSAVVRNNLRSDRSLREKAVRLTPASDSQRCIWRERPYRFEVVRENL